MAIITRNHKKGNYKSQHRDLQQIPNPLTHFCQSRIVCNTHWGDINPPPSHLRVCFTLPDICIYFYVQLFHQNLLVLYPWHVLQETHQWQFFVDMGNYVLCVVFHIIFTWKKFQNFCKYKLKSESNLVSHNKGLVSDIILVSVSQFPHLIFFH